MSVPTASAQHANVFTWPCLYWIPLVKYFVNYYSVHRQRFEAKLQVYSIVSHTVLVYVAVTCGFTYCRLDTGVQICQQTLWYIIDWKDSKGDMWRDLSYG